MEFKFIKGIEAYSANPAYDLLISGDLDPVDFIDDDLQLQMVVEAIAILSDLLDQARAASVIVEL